MHRIATGLVVALAVFVGVTFLQPTYASPADGHVIAAASPAGAAITLFWAAAAGAVAYGYFFGWDAVKKLFAPVLNAVSNVKLAKGIVNDDKTQTVLRLYDLGRFDLLAKKKGVDDELRAVLDDLRGTSPNV